MGFSAERALFFVLPPGGALVNEPASVPITPHVWKLNFIELSCVSQSIFFTYCLELFKDVKTVLSPWACPQTVGLSCLPGPAQLSLLYLLQLPLAPRLVAGLAHGSVLSLPCRRCDQLAECLGSWLGI